MLDWWRHNGPPVYMSVAAYLGLLKEDKPEYSSLEDLEAMFGDEGGVIS